MGNIGMIKRGACLEAPLKGRRVIGGVVDHNGISSGLGVYRREEQEETVNIMQIDATQMHDRETCRARGVLTQYYTIPAKEDNIRESFPEVCIFGQANLRGKVP